MLDPSRTRLIKLLGKAGLKLIVSIPNDDSARDAEDLTGYSAFGKIVDEDGATILTLSPTTGGTAGTFLIDEVIPDSITPGWYRWRGGVTDSAGEEDVRYEGPVHIGSSKAATTISATLLTAIQADLSYANVQSAPNLVKRGSDYYGCGLQTDGTSIVWKWDGSSLTTFSPRSVDVDNHNDGVVMASAHTDDLLFFVSNHDKTGTNGYLWIYRAADGDPSSLQLLHTVEVDEHTYQYAIQHGDSLGASFWCRLEESTYSKWGVYLTPDFTESASPSWTRYEVFAGHYVYLCPEPDGTKTWIATRAPGGSMESSVGNDADPALVRFWSHKVSIWEHVHSSNALLSGGEEEAADITLMGGAINGDSRNRIAQSEDLDNGTYWTANSGEIDLFKSSSVQRFSDTDNPATAKQYRLSTGTGKGSVTHQIRSDAVTVAEGDVQVMSWWVRPDTCDACRIVGVVGSFSSGAADFPYAIIRDVGGTPTLGGNEYLTSTTEDVGWGVEQHPLSSYWYRVWAKSLPSEAGVTGVGGHFTLVDSAGDITFNQDNIRCWVASPQLETGSLTRYVQNYNGFEKPTIEPKTIYSAAEGRACSVHDMKRIPDTDYLDVLVIDVDGYSGTTGANQATSKLYLIRYNTSDHTYKTPRFVCQLGTSGSDGRSTYRIVGDRKILVARNNLDGAGENYLHIWDNGTLTLLEQTTGRTNALSQALPSVEVSSAPHLQNLSMAFTRLIGQDTGQTDFGPHQNDLYQINNLT